MAKNVASNTIYSERSSLCLTSTIHSYNKSNPMNINVEPKKNSYINARENTVREYHNNINVFETL